MPLWPKNVLDPYWYAIMEPKNCGRHAPMPLVHSHVSWWNVKSVMTQDHGAKVQQVQAPCLWYTPLVWSPIQAKGASPRTPTMFFNVVSCQFSLIGALVKNQCKQSSKCEVECFHVYGDCNAKMEDNTEIYTRKNPWSIDDRRHKNLGWWQSSPTSCIMNENHDYNSRTMEIFTIVFVCGVWEVAKSV